MLGKESTPSDTTQIAHDSITAHPDNHIRTQEFHDNTVFAYRLPEVSVATEQETNHASVDVDHTATNTSEYHLQPAFAHRPVTHNVRNHDAYSDGYTTSL